MKPPRTLSGIPLHLQPRSSGVTLVEVLVSMLIMSIGVILLATLLPISILRTAQASQLTHSVFLRNNAESLIESTSLGSYSVLGNSQIPPASPPQPVNAVIDPLGYWISGAANATFGGTLAINRTSAGAGSLIQADQLATLPDSWTLFRNDLVTNYNFSASPPTITLSHTTADINVRNGQNPAYANYRLIMSDITNSINVIRPLYQTGSTAMLGTTLGANQASWQNVDSAGNPIATAAIPSGFVPTNVRIQFQDRRFTWLITSRKQWIDSAATDWIAEVNVAAFFNRSFNPNEEFPYVVALTGNGGFDGRQGVAGVDDDGNGSTDWTDVAQTTPDTRESGWPGSDDNRTITFTNPGSPPGPPFIKKGAFMLEPSQMAWYRIVDSNPSTNTLLLDRDIPPALRGNNFNGIFMKGVVDVYSLGTRTGTQ